MSPWPAALCARVMRLVNLLQPLLDNMGVNLSRRNIRVTEHELDGTEVRAAFKQMRGKTVPQHMRRQRYAHAGEPAIRRKYLPHTDAAQLCAAAIHEQRRIALHLAKQFRPGIAKILFDDGERFFANRNNALLVAFADTTNATDPGIEVGDPQSNELRYAQAGGIQNLEHGAVPEADGIFHIGLVQHALDFFEAKIARQIAPNFGRFEIDCGIFPNQLADLGKTEKVARPWRATVLLSSF